MAVQVAQPQQQQAQGGGLGTLKTAIDIYGALSGGGGGSQPGGIVDAAPGATTPGLGANTSMGSMAPDFSSNPLMRRFVNKYGG